MAPRSESGVLLAAARRVILRDRWVAFFVTPATCNHEAPPDGRGLLAVRAG